MTTPNIDTILKEMEERAENATPSEAITGAYWFCRKDIPNLISALRKAIEQRDGMARLHAEQTVIYVTDAPYVAEKTSAIFNAEIASILRGAP